MYALGKQLIARQNARRIRCRRFLYFRAQIIKCPRAHLSVSLTWNLHGSLAVMLQTENTKLFCACEILFKIAVGLVKYAEKNYLTILNYPRAVCVIAARAACTFSKMETLGSFFHKGPVLSFVIWLSFCSKNNGRTASVLFSSTPSKEKNSQKNPRSVGTVGKLPPSRITENS